MSNPFRKGNVTAEKRNIDKNENSRNLFYRFRLFLFSERVSQKNKSRLDFQKVFLLCEEIENKIRKSKRKQK